MANRFSVDTVFRGIDQMSGVYGPMTAKAKAFEKSLKSTSASATELIEKPVGALQRVGAVAAGGLAVAGTGLIEVMKTGMTFEKALLSAGNKFEAGISKSSETFQRMKVVAQDVGGSTEFSATQAAYGLKELAGAGLTADQAISALRGTVDLATAAEIPDMAQATEVAVKSLGAFGLKSKNAAELATNLERVSDVMVKTDDISSTSVLAFYEAIAEGGAVAKTAGSDIETYGALVAGLSDIEQGSKAGTTLKNMFLTLSKPTKEGAAAFTKFGIKTTDAMGNTRDAIDVLKELRTATSKLGTGDKAGVLEQIFGKIPLAGVMTLMDKIDEVGENRSKLRTEAGGSVNKKAASIRSGGTGAWDNFTSGLEAVSLAIFDLVGGPVTTIIERVTDWIGANRDLIATNISDYLGRAIPIAEAFGDGIYDSFLKVKPVISGVSDALSSVFGGDGEKSPRTQAYQFGRALSTLVFGLVALTAVTKAAAVLTYGYQLVTKVAAGAVWLYEAALVAARWAVFWYGVWSKAGAASTIAIAGASVIATGQMVAQRVAAFGAAVGMRALAVASWAASAPVLAVAAAIAAVLAAAYQLYAFLNENGGIEGLGGALGIGTDDWGFAGVDEVMNRQAKARAAAGNAGGGSSGAPAAVNIGELMKALTDLKEMKAADVGAYEPGNAADLYGLTAGMPNIPGMSMPPGIPAESSQQAAPEVALKEESTAQLSQNLSRDISSALRGTIEIKIKDKGGNAEVSSSTGSGVNVSESGSF